MRISDWSSDVCSSDLNPQVVARSKESLLSPSWSPDGRKIAYVSFESGNSAVYVQDITTGSRQLVASHPRDRKSVVSGKSVSVRVDLGVRRILKKKNTTQRTSHNVHITK